MEVRNPQQLLFVSYFHNGLQMVLTFVGWCVALQPYAAMLFASAVTTCSHWSGKDDKTCHCEDVKMMWRWFKPYFARSSWASTRSRSSSAGGHMWPRFCHSQHVSWQFFTYAISIHQCFVSAKCFASVPGCKPPINGLKFTMCNVLAKWCSGCPRHLLLVSIA